MCVQVKVGTSVCGSVGELKTFLRGSVVSHPGYPDDDRWCLCGVDLDATAVRNGMICRQATEAEGYPFPDFIMVPNALANLPGDKPGQVERHVRREGD